MPNSSALVASCRGARASKAASMALFSTTEPRRRTSPSLRVLGGVVSGQKVSATAAAATTLVEASARSNSFADNYFDMAYCTARRRYCTAAYYAAREDGLRNNPETTPIDPADARAARRKASFAAVGSRPAVPVCVCRRVGGAPMARVRFISRW